jgi:hypothetical protein
MLSSVIRAASHWMQDLQIARHQQQQGIVINR